MPTSLPPAARMLESTLELARQLIARRSITPDDAGCFAIVETRLAEAGFKVERFDRNGVANLWARAGEGGPLFCLAGHIDVVPAGPLVEWTSDPFTPTERDGFLYGRGASDMKGPLAAMITAAERVAKDRRATGSVALLLTSDEEGDAVDGTAAIVEALSSRGERIDACLVGEPTSAEVFGDTIKVGRRGSLGGSIRIAGIQCHIAYPERGRNPILEALSALQELASTEWDQGNSDFSPTNFQISNIHAGTGAVNVIPGVLDVAFNLRFSPESTAGNLQQRILAILDRHGLTYQVDWKPIAHPFTTARGPLVDVLSSAIRSSTGVNPVLSTSGGTSDGRFLATMAREVVEFGPINETIHKVDERIRTEDLGGLSSIYERVIRDWLRLTAL